MADERKNDEMTELSEDEVYTYTLTDEEGNEYEFELMGVCEMDGKVYYAMAPVDAEDNEQYTILRAEEEADGDVMLTTIEDDDEFEKVSEYFDDELFGEVDFDAE